MNSSSSTTPVLEVRGARASSVIIQRIPAEAADAFMDWQRGISAAAAQYPGYQTTEIYPATATQKDWVIILHFNDAGTLKAWLDSPTRAEWIAKLPCEIRNYRMQTLPAGFGAWFAGVTQNGAPLPHYKIALTVLLFLYPIVMLLAIFLTPHTKHFGLAVSMLIGNAVSVSILEWMCTPLIRWLFGPWLKASWKEQPAVMIFGIVVILVALGVLTWLFSLVT